MSIHGRGTILNCLHQLSERQKKGPFLGGIFAYQSEDEYWLALKVCKYERTQVCRIGVQNANLWKGTSQ